MATRRQLRMFAGAVGTCILISACADRARPGLPSQSPGIPATSTPAATSPRVTPPSSSIATSPSSPSAPAAPAVAQASGNTPAAGACGGAVGAFAVVEANPDTPNPRCQIVKAEQRLRVVNTSNRFGQPGEAITVTFANFSPRRLAIGESTTFDRRFRDCIEPGVHHVRISLYPGPGGAEIWLKQ